MTPNFLTDSLEPKKNLDITGTILVLWQRKKLISIVVSVATLVSIVVSLLLTAYYSSTTIILPETEKSKVGGLSALSDLASMTGINVGTEGSLVRLYPTIIKSEAVLSSVLLAKYQTKEFRDSVTLIEFWGLGGKTPAETYDKTLGAFREALDVSQDFRTGVVTIRIETREPQLSADIVNGISAQLDRFIRTKRTTNASEQRRWIESRLLEVKSDLQKSENALRDFREKNRFTGGSPQLQLDQERLVREVQINSTLFTELKKQYELAKIEEIKNIPIINIMDVGRPAATKAWPRRRVIVIFSSISSLLIAVGYVLLSRRYKNKLVVFISGFRRSSIL